MRGINSAPPRIPDYFARLLDLAKKPVCQARYCAANAPASEEKLCLAVTLRIVNLDGILQMAKRLPKIPLHKAGSAKHRQGKRCFRYPRGVLRVAPKSLCDLATLTPRRRARMPRAKAP